MKTPPLIRTLYYSHSNGVYKKETPLAAFPRVYTYTPVEHCILANLNFLKCRTSKRNLQDYLTFCRTYSIAVLILYACVYKVWLLFSGTSPFICRAVVKFMQICRTVLQNQGQLASMALGSVSCHRTLQYSAIVSVSL